MVQEKKFYPDSSKIDVDLRKKAEDVLRDKQVFSPEPQKEISSDEIQRTLHELQVHQLELEMQNEALRNAQAALDTERARYFELYDLAPVGYCTLSEAGLILETNLTAASFLGFPKSVLLKQPVSRYIQREDQDIYYLHRKQLFETGAPQVCELRMVDNTETARWVRLNANLAKDEDGAPTCRIVLSDISERKRVEAEKAEIEAQFQQRQKLESVGRLAGGVAHEFNNKLTIILGLVEILMEKSDQDGQTYSDLKEIRNAAEHSATLTRQLLGFARKQIIVTRKINLNDSVTGLLHMLSQLIGENIKLSWLPQTDLWPVKIDPSQLDQILTNLCVNARDAIKGVGKIVITAENTTLDDVSCATYSGSLPGDYILLTVSDSGCGIDRKTLGQIFEPFFTTKEVGRGTGLGLATVYGVVKQNNGCINVQSVPGSGTSFKIHLPRAKEHVTRIPEENLPEPTPIGTGTILLVEDELSILKMTTRMLQSLGYEVLAANSPSEAIALAKEYCGKINLIMTDMLMPEMNGKELVDSILSFSPQLKALFMSGYSKNIISQERNFDTDIHFIQKPFTKKDLDNEVRMALEY